MSISISLIQIYEFIRWIGCHGWDICQQDTNLDLLHINYTYYITYISTDAVYSGVTTKMKIFSFFLFFVAYLYFIVELFTKYGGRME